MIKRSSAQIGYREGGLLADRLLATEQAIQLDELIKWVLAQETVAVSEPAK